MTDDGTGPRLCWSAAVEFGGGSPQVCDGAGVTGWDWDTAGGSEEVNGVRRGWFTLTGTFDGSTFAVEEATQPEPDPYEWDFEIPCPAPAGGWQVLDPARTTEEARATLTTTAEALPGFALIAVSTPDGEPGPRDPMDTVVSLYVAGDPEAAESRMREVWGGMLCVTPVEHSHAELSRIQHDLLDLPGVSEVGSGNPDNQVEVTVFHDDGRYQQWVDQEYGEDVVVVGSVLQPVG